MGRKAMSTTSPSMATAENDDDDVVIVGVTSPTSAATDSARDAERAGKRARVDGPDSTSNGAGATTKSDDDTPLFRLLRTEVSAPSFPSTSSTLHFSPRASPYECPSTVRPRAQKLEFLLKPTLISKFKPRGSGVALLKDRQTLQLP